MIEGKQCATCDAIIPPERLEILPNTIHCTKCVDKYGPKKTYDPELYCSKSSPSGQNGWTKAD